MIHIRKQSYEALHDLFLNEKNGIKMYFLVNYHSFAIFMIGAINQKDTS
jgi:hypothetical protein